MVSQARGVACEIVMDRTQLLLLSVACETSYYSPLFLLYRSHLDSIIIAKLVICIDRRHR